jgi:hypothetical protein
MPTSPTDAQTAAADALLFGGCPVLRAVNPSTQPSSSECVCFLSKVGRQAIKAVGRLRDDDQTRISVRLVGVHFSAIGEYRIGFTGDEQSCHEELDQSSVPTAAGVKWREEGEDPVEPSRSCQIMIANQKVVV